MQLRNTKEKIFFPLCLVLLVASVAVCQPTQIDASPAEERPIHLLVIGDSILWGQGLRTENKSWYEVKLWLEKNTGRKVIERVEAHSGAVIERGSITDNVTSDNREVNLAIPALHDQIDNALAEYADPSKVDLILLSGCGNDVGLLNLLNAANTREVDDMTNAKCGRPIENLLRRILGSFPAARVILTGYYPFFSEKTRNDFIVKALAGRFFKTQPDSTPKMSNKEIFERLKINSKQWYETSNNRLTEAVQTVNAELDGGRARVVFAKLDFPADYSFAAPKTHLWGFDRSPFRMMLLFLSFGKVLLPSNDDMRSQRSSSCAQLYKKKTNETSEDKKKRKAQLMLCRYAALGHPNKKGALLYTNSITNILNSSFGNTMSGIP